MGEYQVTETHMHVTIKATGIEITPAIEAYVRDKFQAIERLAREDASIGRIATLAVEVGKTTNHHHSGDIFRAEATLKVGAELYRTEYETSDLYSAVDVTKDEMIDVLSKSKDKRENLFRKGSRMIKKLLRRE